MAKSEQQKAFSTISSSITKLASADAKLNERTQATFEAVVRHCIEHKCPELASKFTRTLLTWNGETQKFESRSRKFKAAVVQLESLLPLKWAGGKVGAYRKDAAQEWQDVPTDMPSIFDTVATNKAVQTPVVQATKKINSLVTSIDKLLTENASLLTELDADTVKAINLLRTVKVKQAQAAKDAKEADKAA